MAVGLPCDVVVGGLPYDGVRGHPYDGEGALIGVPQVEGHGILVEAVDVEVHQTFQGGLGEVAPWEVHGVLDGLDAPID